MVAGQANPLPTDGVVGKLTPEQTEKLKEFWKELLRLVDEAPKEGSGGSAPPPSDDQSGDKIPKDDNAKERMKAEQEKRDAMAAFTEYGSTKFMACFWRFIAMDDPDNIALRFLRARKWSVSAGVAMLCACLRWRMSSDVEDIFEKGEEGMRNAEGFIKQMQIGKTYTQGTDRYGRPIVYIHVAKHRTFDQSPVALEQFVIFQMESVRCLFGGVGIDKVTMVFDMTGFGVRNMDWRCILFIVKCLEAYYPESLNVMLIHNAPWVFQGIWKLLAPMLDPVVRNKVEMTKNTEDLVVHIPKHHLVKPLGGTSEWKWEYPEIIPGENAPQKDKEGRRAAQKDRDALLAAYEKATRDWIKAAPGDAKADKKRKLAVLEMRAQYFVLDPFIRGRGAYHRNGNIVGNGLVVFEYPNGSGDKLESEWDVRGYDMSREYMLAQAADMRKELKMSAKAK
ncbi:CRAL/TRIO domain-containing protein [Meredithblackwellia eburnea MCA 4105]